MPPSLFTRSLYRSFFSSFHSQSHLPLSTPFLLPFKTIYISPSCIFPSIFTVFVRTVSSNRLPHIVYICFVSRYPAVSPAGPLYFRPHATRPFTLDRSTSRPRVLTFFTVHPSSDALGRTSTSRLTIPARDFVDLSGSLLHIYDVHHFLVARAPLSCRRPGTQGRRARAS